MCVNETTQLQYALKPQTLAYKIGDWPSMQPRTGVKTPEMSRNRTSASSMMRTLKRLEDGSPVRPASYELLATAGYLVQISRDDLDTGPMPGRKTDGPSIQQGSIGRFLTPV